MSKHNAIVVPKELYYHEVAYVRDLERKVASHAALVAALQQLHDNNAEYGRINNLGGYDNQDMQAARAALKLAGATP